MAPSRRNGVDYYSNTGVPPYDPLPEKLDNSLNEAIKAKNEAKLDQAFDEMSAGCNRCHGGCRPRFYLVIRRLSSRHSAIKNPLHGARPSERQKQGALGHRVFRCAAEFLAAMGA